MVLGLLYSSISNRSAPAHLNALDSVSKQHELTCLESWRRIFSTLMCRPPETDCGDQSHFRRLPASFEGASVAPSALCSRGQDYRAWLDQDDGSKQYIC